MSVRKHTLNDREQVALWKWLLGHWSLDAIESHYISFKTGCYVSNRTPEFVKEEVDRLFAIDNISMPFQHGADLPLVDKITYQMQFPYCFRVRPVSKMIDENGKLLIDLWINKESSGKITVDTGDMSVYSDVWEKPLSLCTKYERLNAPNERVLYTSFEPSTAILETGIKKGDYFFLITYKRETDIFFSDCARFIAYDELTETENLKRYIIFNLLRNEFTRVLPHAYDLQHQYAVSYAIAKKFFTLANTCGMQYPSTKGLGANNFVFTDGNAQKYLSFVCVRLCQLCADPKRLEMQPKILVDGYWENNQFVWFDPASDDSKSRLSDHKLLDILFQK